jgi:hypothetical protein
MTTKTSLLAACLLAAVYSAPSALPPQGAENTAAEAAAPETSFKDSLLRRLRAAADFLLKPGPSAGRAAALTVLAPFDGTVFPRDIRSPEFSWDGPVPAEGAWTVTVSFKNSPYVVRALAKEPRWTPERAVWEDIRARSLENTATFEVSASTYAGAPGAARATFLTSKDPVGAPIFFRAVPSGKVFPSEEDYVKVKWKLGWVSSYTGPITVMKNQTTCFNCHSASANGRTFGFDYNSNTDDMSSYLFFRDPGRTATFVPKNVFDWNDYKRGNNRFPFQANASAISPDGKVIATAGRALSFVAPKCTDLIQYALPMRGIILYRTVSDPAIHALPGADDESFIRYASSWSPDGKYIYFFGAPVTPELMKRGSAKLEGENTDDKRALGWREFDKIYPILYDVYRIPFNGGKGGRPERIAGAGANGRSNYSPRVSPDGKWVVFTQSANGALLIREDSDLYIVPAAGGKARKLRSNGPRADSWHSWSPNGRWLVFASKSHGPHTDLVLTHIDAAGQDSPPVVLTQMRDEDGLASNLPEFYNIKPGQLEEIVPKLR